MMPARSLAGRDGAALGATATCSVAACICRELRRQNTIDSPPAYAEPLDPFRILQFSLEAGCTLPGTGRASVVSRTHRNPKNVNKSKGPDNCPGLWVNLRATAPITRLLRAALPAGPDPRGP